MPDQDDNPQDQRTGGYGGSAGGANPAQEGNPAEGEHGTSAAGREGNVRDAMDGDEALGNRTGGYGGNPASTDEEMQRRTQE